MFLAHLGSHFALRCAKFKKSEKNGAQQRDRACPDFFFIFFGTLHEWNITFGQQKMNFGGMGLADRPVD